MLPEPCIHGHLRAAVERIERSTGSKAYDIRLVCRHGMPCLAHEQGHGCLMVSAHRKVLPAEFHVRLPEPERSRAGGAAEAGIEIRLHFGGNVHVPYPVSLDIKAHTRSNGQEPERRRSIQVLPVAVKFHVKRKIIEQVSRAGCTLA